MKRIKTNKPKVVILAAGFGNRLKRGSPKAGKIPKPLIKVFGLPLIEHKLVHFRDTEIYIVYSDERVKEYLSRKTKDYPGLKFIKNEHPERENGYSLYLLKKYIKPDEKFVLVMADHLYHESFYEKVREFWETEEIPPDAEAVVIATEKCDDPAEATKLKLPKTGKSFRREGPAKAHGEFTGEFIKARNIGKKLKSYDAFDSGLFICTGRIIQRAASLEKSKEKFKLSDDLMKSAAKEGKFYAYIHEAPWMDIDTQEDLKKARRFIRKLLVKPTDGPVSKLLNRKISTLVSPLLISLPFATPNFLTLATTLLGFLSAYLISTGRLIAGGILVQITSILDGCDGEVARIKNLKSRFGALLDSTLDRYVDSFVVFAMFVFWLLNPTRNITLLKIPVQLLLPLALWGLLLSLTGTIMVSYVSHLGGARPYFATRDVRLLLLSLGAVLYRVVPLPLSLFIVGLLSHAGVAYSILKRTIVPHFQPTPGKPPEINRIF